MLASFVRTRTGKAAAAAILVLAVAVIVGPFLWPHGANDPDTSAILQAPSISHPFGTDELGRDLLARVLAGGRVSLSIGVAAASLSFLVGVPLGIIAGYLRGLADGVIMRVMDFLLALPAILLALVVIASLGRSSINAFIAVGIAGVPAFARVARAATLELSTREFVLGTRTLGARHTYVMFRTILPNALLPLIVQFAVTVATAILLESGLSFLGLGSPPPAATWGAMLQTSLTHLYQSPTYGIVPGVAISAAILSFDTLARVLQRQMDKG